MRDVKILVIRNGIAKEIQLSWEIVRLLEDAYENGKVVGISQKTYNGMVELLEDRLMEYHRLLEEKTDGGMYAKTVAFAQAFEIYSDESPMVFEVMCWINREVEMNKKFSCRSINCQSVTGFIKTDINVTYRSLMKDFKEWACCLFSSKGLHIGLVKFAKFFYSIICDQ